MDSVGKTNALLTELSGYSNFLFRAPLLSVNKDMQAYIEAPFIGASIDSRDWDNGSTTEKIIENALIIQKVIDKTAFLYGSKLNGIIITNNIRQAVISKTVALNCSKCCLIVMSKL